MTNIPEVHRLTSAQQLRIHTCTALAKFKHQLRLRKPLRFTASIKTGLPQVALQLGSPTLSVRSKISKLPEINTLVVRIFS